MNDFFFHSLYNFTGNFRILLTSRSTVKDQVYLLYLVLLHRSPRKVVVDKQVLFGKSSKSDSLSENWLTLSLKWWTRTKKNALFWFLFLWKILSIFHQLLLLAGVKLPRGSCFSRSSFSAYLFDLLFVWFQRFLRLEEKKMCDFI